MNAFSEDNLVEQTVIKLIKEVWADSKCHINSYSENDDSKFGREHRGEVVLKNIFYSEVWSFGSLFYKMEVGDAGSGKVFSETKRMMMLK